MRASAFLALVGAVTLTSGCTVFHTEMLGESIRTFSSRGFKPNDKVWISNPEDSLCDAACAGCKKESGGSMGGLGSLFSSAPKSGASSYDKLAYEVFSNYLTQRHKVKVVETHRHNYATELNPETHRKVEVTMDSNKINTTSCEDLCMLDEAKKRKADKVLVYHIIDMEADKMTIHFRLSDVASGVVEQSQTMKIIDLRAQDFSYGGGGGGGGAPPPRSSRQQSSDD
jgi:hypothetical protein